MSGAAMTTLIAETPGDLATFPLARRQDAVDALVEWSETAQGRIGLLDWLDATPEAAAALGRYLAYQSMFRLDPPAETQP